MMKMNRKDMETFLKQVYDSVDNKGIKDKELEHEINTYWKTEWEAWKTR